MHHISMMQVSKMIVLVMQVFMMHVFRRYASRIHVSIMPVSTMFIPDACFPMTLDLDTGVYDAFIFDPCPCCMLDEYVCV